MAIVLKDRVKQSASAPGTGTITLGATATGFQAFSAIGNGNVTYFAIVDAASGAWEVNYGTYTSSGTTLSRNATPLSSSAAGALVNFTGTVDVFCTYPSSKAIYEETTGNVLIDGGPITVVGNGVASYTTFSAALGELYANVNNFAQFYAQNLNGGSEASGDFVAYRNDSTGTTKFVDLGINSSNYSSVSYPIFTAGSAYLFNNTGEMFIGSETDDLILFAGGVATTDWAARIDKTSKLITTKAALTLGGALTGIGGSFTSPVTTTSSMATPGATELVTKTYVDNATSSALIFHTAVQAASVSAFNEAATVYNNGTAGVGATLTRVSSFITFVIDGYSPSVNQRVLIKDQTTQAWNGVYTVTTVGSPSVGFVLTRATDADTAGSGANLLSLNDYFYVQNGTVNKGTAYVLSAPSGTITFGTSNIQFAEFSSSQIYTGTSPIDITSTVISLTTVPATLGGTGTATVTTGDLLYGSATNTWNKLAAGAGYKSLTMNAGGTLPEWNAVALDQSGAVSGALGATNGGTAQSSYATGDILYASAANTLAKLAGNITTTKKYLIQTGGGAVSAAPSWGTVDGADVTGNISGSAGSVANALTLGTYLTGTSFNGSAAVTATVDATSANTASKVVARDVSGNFAAGTITAALTGNASTATAATNISAGAANQIPYQAGAATTSFVVAPTVTGSVLSWNGSAFAYATNIATATSATSATTATNLAGGSAGTVPYQSAAGTTAMLAAGSSGQVLQSNGAAAPSWVAATAAANNGTLTMAVSGTGLSGSASFTANQAGASSFTVTSNATNANTGSTIVARDASGNFSAGTITATLSGNASTATSATSATTATTATTANATNTSNNFQMNSLGVGTAGSGTAGEIRATNNVTAYYSSDIKFKENVRNIPNAAATAAAIGGKLFDWKAEYIEEHGGEDGYFIVKSDFGVIAQDVLAKFPVAVRTRPDGSLAVDYEKLSALALAANAEHEERIAKLEALVAKLIEG